MVPLPDASMLLGAVCAVMVLLVLRDLLQARRLTVAARVRLMVALIFAAVVLWLHRSGAG